MSNHCDRNTGPACKWPAPDCSPLCSDPSVGETKAPATRRSRVEDDDTRLCRCCGRSRCCCEDHYGE